MFSTDRTSAQASISDLPAVLEKIEANWPVLPSGIWNSSSIQTLSRHLHQLARRSDQLGETALQAQILSIDEQINDIIDGNTPPDSDQIDTLNDALQRLKQKVSALQLPDKAAAIEAVTTDLLHLPQHQGECGQIEQAVTSQQWRYRACSDLQTLFDALSEAGARAILIDSQYLPELSRHLDQLRSGKRARPGLFIIADHLDIETRLSALRAGVTQLFSKPIDCDALVAALGECIEPTIRPRDRILIVEDDESQATFAANLLHKGKLDTLAITDPLQVIEAVRRFQPDLILMDLYMPGADGIELTRLIRGRSGSAAIPIVFLSGEDDLEKKLLALQAGADDFINKPVRPQQLLATVKTRIERARTITATALQMGQADKQALPDRRALLSRLDLSRGDFRQGQQFHALLVLCLSDLEVDSDNLEMAAGDRRIDQVATVLKPLLQTEDYLASIGHESLAILFRRPTEQAVEQLGDQVYATAIQRLKAATPDRTQLGVGLSLLDSTAEHAFDMLSHAEASALSAYQRGVEGYELFGEEQAVEEEPESPPQAAPLAQFLQALHDGSVAFHEQHFASHQASEGGIETLELVPQYANPEADHSPIQDAVRYGAVGEFDHYVCEQAIGRLGEFALQGKRVRLIFRQSASVIQDDTYLEFIKTALRKRQIVGTGLMVDFDLPSLAIDLKRARALFGELSALGIGVSLSNFACNETAYKVLAYLQAEAVRPHPSLLHIDAQKIQHITAQIHSLRAEIILPLVQQHNQIGLSWSDSADYVQSGFTS